MLLQWWNIALVIIHDFKISLSDRSAFHSVINIIFLFSDRKRLKNFCNDDNCLCGIRDHKISSYDGDNSYLISNTIFSLLLLLHVIN